MYYNLSIKKVKRFQYQKKQNIFIGVFPSLSNFFLVHKHLFDSKFRQSTLSLANQDICFRILVISVLFAASSKT